jgi:hypothetical protein
MKFFFLFFLLAIFFMNCSMSSENNVSKKSIEELFSEDKDKFLKESFKNYLVRNRISLDSKLENKFEAIQSGNLYSNFYFNLSIDLPDKWSIDRGVGEYAIIRAIQSDSAISISLNVSPLVDNGKTDLKGNPNTLAYLNELYEGDYRSTISQLIASQSGIEPEEFTIKEFKAGTNDFIETSYLIREHYENEVFYTKMSTFQTIKFNTVYTINYSAPEVFYKTYVIHEILLNFKIINPNIGF